MTIKLKDKANRKLSERADRAGPNCGSHWKQVVVAEQSAQASPLKILLHSHLVRNFISVARSHFVELQDVQHHPVKRRPNQIPALSEHRIQTAATVFEARPIAGNAESHFRRYAINLQMVHQTQKVGVRSIVADNKARVDAVLFSVDFDVNGVSVASDVAARFEYLDVVLTVEQPCGRHPGNPAADNGDLHQICLSTPLATAEGKA